MRALKTVALAVVCAAPLAGQINKDEALRLAFPGAEIERHTAYLDDAQLSRAADLAGAGVPVEKAVVTYYSAVRDGQEVGRAYFDAHPVRTLPEVLMIVLDPTGKIRTVETVAFREPPEYEAPERWLRLFDGRRLDEELSLKGSVPNVTGASLTAKAVTASTRRVLALHGVLAPSATAQR